MALAINFSAHSAFRRVESLPSSDSSQSGSAAAPKKNRMGALVREVQILKVVPDPRKPRAMTGQVRAAEFFSNKRNHTKTLCQAVAEEAQGSKKRIKKIEEKKLLFIWQKAILPYLVEMPYFPGQSVMGFKNKELACLSRLSKTWNCAVSAYSKEAISQFVHNYRETLGRIQGERYFQRFGLNLDDTKKGLALITTTQSLKSVSFAAAHQYLWDGQRKIFQLTDKGKTKEMVRNIVKRAGIVEASILVEMGKALPFFFQMLADMYSPSVLDPEALIAIFKKNPSFSTILAQPFSPPFLKTPPYQKVVKEFFAVSAAAKK